MRKSLTAGLALASAAVLTSTGCSSSGSSSSGASSATLPLAQMNIQPRSSLKQGGTLRFAISQMPINWNLLTIDGNGGDAQTMTNFYMPNLFLVDEKGTLSANKDYVESYDVKDASGSTPQTVTLHLNPKAKWNSGRAIDWTDFQAMWKANNGSNAAFKNSTSDGFNLVKSVAKGSKDTDVVITYSKPSPDWQAPFSNLFPKELEGTANAYNTAEQSAPNAAWESGPFVFSKLDKAQKVATFVRNPKWWGDPALLDSITFRELQSPADVQAFANNEIDVVTPIISASAYKTAQKRSDGEIRESQGVMWRQITVNSKGGNLSDVKVRRAVEEGIDTKTITASDLAGMPVDAAKQQLGNHFFMPGHKYYQDNSGDVAYNPDKAKSDLDAAGWTLPSGQQYRTKNGKTLTINFTVLSGVPTSENESKLVQNQLAKIGVKVNLVNIAPTDMNKTLSSHSFEMLAFTWQNTIFPMNNIRQIYGASAPGKTDPSGSNYAQLVNPEIEKLIPQADSEMDQTKRAALTNQIDKLIFDEVHTIPLYTRVNYTAVPKNLANFGSSLYLTVPLQNIGFMK